MPGKSSTKAKPAKPPGKKKGKGAKLITAPIAAKPQQKPPESVFDVASHPSKGPCVAQEVFNLQKLQKEPPLKVNNFVDPDGNPPLPASLTSACEGQQIKWVRVSEVAMYEGETLRMYIEQDGPRCFNGLIAPANRWSQVLASCMSLVNEQKHRIPADTGCLWELLYPQDKGGPKMNDKNKYTVKLFHQGQWRAFVVDDLVPVDESGTPLLPISKHPQEIWPLIVSKALLKLSWGADICGDGADFLYPLCGWVPTMQDLKDTTSDEQGFHWYDELQKSLVASDGPEPPGDGSVIAALVYVSIDPAASPVTSTPTPDSPGAKAGAGAGAGAKPGPAAVKSPVNAGAGAAAGAAAAPATSPLPNEAALTSAGTPTSSAALLNCDGGVLLKEAMLSMYMVVPYVPPKPLEEDGIDSHGKGSGKKGKPPAKGNKTAKKPPPAKKGRPKSGGKKGGDTNENPHADDEEKKEGAEEVVPPVDRVNLVNLSTGAVETIKKIDLPGVFDCIHLLHNPPSVQHQQVIEHVWTDTKKPFSSSSPIVFHVPPVPVDEPGTRPASAKRPASGKARPGSAKHVEKPPGTPPAPAETKYVKVLLSVEAHRSAASTGGPPNPGADSEGDMSTLTPSPPATNGPLLSFSVERYNWETNSKIIVSRITSHLYRATMELVLPAGLPCVYYVHVNTECGYYLNCYSTENVEMSDATEMGSLFTRCLNIYSESVHSAYAAQPSASPGSSCFVLAKAQVMVQDLGWTPDAPGVTKSGKNSVKDKAKNRATSAAGMVTSHFKTPFLGEADSRVSVCLNISEASLLPFTTLEWVDNDTLVSTRCGFAFTAPLRLRPNESGYTLIAHCQPPCPVYGGKVEFTLLSSKPLASFSPETLQVTDFTGPAKPNSEYVIFRNVVGNGSNNPVSSTVIVTLSDPKAGFVCSMFDAEDVANAMDEGEQAASPIKTLVGIGAVVFPSVEVSKEQSRLIQLVLDPLTPGEILCSDTEPQAEIKWEVRVVSTVPSTLATDKTQDNHFAEIKTSWEKAQAGRSKKAKASREAFLASKQSLDTLVKQPIVTPVPELERRLMSSEDAMRLRAVQEEKEAKGKLLLQKIMEIRKQEMGDGQTASVKRDIQYTQWRERALKDAESQLNARAEYRTKMVEEEELIMALREILEQPVPTMYDIETNVGRPSSRKGPAKGNKSLTMGSFVESITNGLDAIRDVPKWKSALLRAQCVSTIRSAAVSALKEALAYAHDPTPVDDGKKKKGGDERADPLTLMQAAVDHARSLKGEMTDLEVDAWSDRVERHIHELLIASFDTILHPPDEEEAADTSDPDVIAELQSVLTKIETLNRKLNSGESKVVNRIRDLVKAHRDAVNSSGSTPDPKGGKKSSKGGRKKK